MYKEKFAATEMLRNITANHGKSQTSENPATLGFGNHLEERL